MCALPSKQQSQQKLVLTSDSSHFNNAAINISETFEAHIHSCTHISTCVHIYFALILRTAWISNVLRLLP